MVRIFFFFIFRGLLLPMQAHRAPHTAVAFRSLFFFFFFLSPESIRMRGYNRSWGCSYHVYHHCPCRCGFFYWFWLVGDAVATARAALTSFLLHPCLSCVCISNFGFVYLSFKIARKCSSHQIHTRTIRPHPHTRFQRHIKMVKKSHLICILYGIYS